VIICLLIGVLLVINPSIFEKVDLISDLGLSSVEMPDLLDFGFMSYNSDTSVAQEQSTSQSTSYTSDTNERVQSTSWSISSVQDTNEIEQLIFQYTNEERRAKGENPLKWDDELASIARAHSEDMAENDYFSHTNLKGDGPTERAEKAGYPIRKDLSGGYYAVGIGENINEMPTGNVVGIGYVSNTPDDIAKTSVESWMESLGHRQNILDSEYTNIGVGVAYDGHYYICTQDFW